MFFLDLSNQSVLAALGVDLLEFCVAEVEGTCSGGKSKYQQLRSTDPEHPAELPPSPGASGSLHSRYRISPASCFLGVN